MWNISSSWPICSSLQQPNVCFQMSHRVWCPEILGTGHTLEHWQCLVMRQCPVRHNWMSYLWQTADLISLPWCLNDLLWGFDCQRSACVKWQWVLYANGSMLWIAYQLCRDIISHHLQFCLNDSPCNSLSPEWAAPRLTWSLQDDAPAVP